MTEILDRIDNSLAGDLCPCGAQPREGSPYCSEDCVPNYHAQHTTSDTDGTQMRWRPDLVTAHADDGLEPVEPPAGFENFGYNGTRNVSLYRRTGTDRWHLRLDDGNRFVGCDIDPAGLDHDQVPAAVNAAWERLEQELTDRRRLDPDPWHVSGDPWAHLGTGTGTARVASPGEYASGNWRQLGTVADDGIRDDEPLTIQFDNSARLLQPIDSAAVRWSLLAWFPVLPPVDTHNTFRITAT